MRTIGEIEDERARLEAEDAAAEQAEDAATTRQARLADLDAEARAARLGEAERKRDGLADRQRLAGAYRVKLEALMGRYRDLEPDLRELEILGTAMIENGRQLAALGVILPKAVPVPVDLGRTRAFDVETLRGLAQVYGAFAHDPRGRVWSRGR